MRHSWVLLALVVGGCGATTKTELEHSAPQAQIFRYPDNYQAIFRRVSESAKRCLAGEFLLAHGRMAIDAQLYSDLGFGEISHYLSHALLPRHHFSAKIERDGEGSKMTIKADAAMFIRFADQWARAQPNERGCM